MSRVNLRLFAGAAEAAGTDRAAFEADTVGALRRVMTEHFGEAFGSVLGRCSVMVDGVYADRDAALVDGAGVDVLPPFAGG